MKIIRSQLRRLIKEEIHRVLEAVDTDGDGTPNYLDPDDDGDGVPTAQELRDPADERYANAATIDTELNAAVEKAVEYWFPDVVPKYAWNSEPGDEQSVKVWVDQRLAYFINSLLKLVEPEFSDYAWKVLSTGSYESQGFINNLKKSAFPMGLPTWMNKEDMIDFASEFLTIAATKPLWGRKLPSFVDRRLQQFV